MTRRVRATFEPPIPPTHFEVEVRYGERWKTQRAFYGMDWEKAQPERFTHYEEAARVARELALHTYRETRVVEVSP